jgi:Copper binding periplasmic protein CusF
MTRLLITTLLVVFTVACSKGQPPATASTPTPTASATATAEKSYPMTATIVSRDPAKNTVNLDNQAVPGEMAAMKMDYELRGAKVASLPPDGTKVDLTMHDRDGAYYVTEVKLKK